jgi:hypothetical protein
LSDVWLPEVEVPDEFEEIGCCSLEVSVGGKQGVYVDMEDLKRASPVTNANNYAVRTSLTCDYGDSRTLLVRPIGRGQVQV